MGDASKRLRRFLGLHPHCCYCGGKNQAETIDHAPPKAIFRDKYRAMGMEVPACGHCNRQHADFDDFFAFLTFMQSSAHDNKVERRLSGMISSAVKRFPEATFELVKSGRRRYVDVGGILLPRVQTTFESKEIHYTVNYSVARLAAAIFYLDSEKSLPIGTKIIACWTSNAQPLPAAVTHDLLSKLPNYMSLKQGRIDQSNQFESRYIFDQNSGSGMVMMSFHRSFAATAFVSADRYPLDTDIGDYLFVVSENGIEPLNQPFPPNLRRRSRSKNQ